MWNTTVHNLYRRTVLLCTQMHCTTVHSMVPAWPLFCLPITEEIRCTCFALIGPLGIFRERRSGTLIVACWPRPFCLAERAMVKTHCGVHTEMKMQDFLHPKYLKCGKFIIIKFLIISVRRGWTGDMCVSVCLSVLRKVSNLHTAECGKSHGPVSA